MCIVGVGSMASTALESAAHAARQMIRRGLKGALATRDAATGAPYTSMVLLATELFGAPLTLISTLARHTRNLAASADASLLIDVSNAAGDAESGGRISLMGQFNQVDPQHARVRFLDRHPAATGYADFADFAFYRFEITSGHFIEGFGRIVPLARETLKLGPDEFAGFAGPGLERAVADLQKRWPFISGLDPEGVDLRFAGRSDRLAFPVTAISAEAARDAAANCLAAYAQDCENELS
jgi:Pyridoxamine 5'-phosphate oxidase